MTKGRTELASEYRCSYCDGSLDRRYYFCTHCATPWRDPDPHIYGDEPEWVPGLETRISEEGRPALDFFCLIAAGLIGIGMVGAMAGEEALGTVVIIQDLVIAAVTLFFAVQSWGEISHLLRQVRINGVLLASVPLLAGLLVINQVYHGFLMEALELEAGGDVISRLAGVFSWPALFLTLCVFPAIFEELAFRGFVQERLTRAGGVMAGVILTSILFVMLHFSILSAPYLFVLSLFLCWVRLRTESLYPVIALHFLHNTAVLLLLQGSY